MASTNSYTFGPTVAEAIDEAWERCGKDPESLTARHAKSAIRSMAYMLSHWPNKGVLQWTVDLIQQNLTAGMMSFTPPAGTIDLLDVTLLREGYETPMVPMSREDYQAMANKAQTGRPNQFFVRRSITPEVFIWPAAENSTDSIKAYRIRAIQDVGTLPNTIDIPTRWQESFVSGLAAHLAGKFAPERVDGLLAYSIRAFAEAKSEDRERADFVVHTRQGQYRRRG